jgi:hypothetical protein
MDDSGQSINEKLWRNIKNTPSSINYEERDGGMAAHQLRTIWAPAGLVPPQPTLDRKKPRSYLSFGPFAVKFASQQRESIRL